MHKCWAVSFSADTSPVGMVEKATFVEVIKEMRSSTARCTGWLVKVTGGEGRSPGSLRV